MGLTVTACRWTGLGAGHGCLWGRQVEVVAEGRGAAARLVRARLWLPSPEGEVSVVSRDIADQERREMSDVG
jgi:hypothetical protein